MKNAFFVLVLVSLSLNSRAFTHDDEVHFAAHVGTSFALQTVFYGINSRAFQMSKPWSEVCAAVETLAIGFAYKYEENADSDATRTSMAENAIGVGLAIGTHYVFHF